MLIHCPGRKCNTTMDHKLKVDTNEVVCMSCGESNGVVTDFMKTAMKANGDIFRPVSKKAFMYACRGCNANREVYLVKDKAHCKICNAEIFVPPASIEAIKATSHLSEPSNTDEADKKLPVNEVSKGKIKRSKKS